MADEIPKTTPPPSDQAPQPTAENEHPAAPPAAAELEPPALTETGAKEQEPLPPPPSLPEVTESEKEELPPPVAAVVESESEEKTQKEEPERKQIPRSLISFKEESNIVADLSDSERKTLQELKQLVQEALNSHQFTSPKLQETQEKAAAEAPPLISESETKPTHEPKIEENPLKEAEEVAKEATQLAVPPEEVSIWGVPLLKDDRSDVILLKFLRARDFKVKDAFTMLGNTIQWRKEFGIDALVDEDLGDDLEKVVFMHGYDREGHPVCYNVFGEFQNKELYQKTFLDEEKRTKFLRWRVQFLERSIRKLDFRPGGICTIFQVNDLKNSPGPAKKELRIATKQALQLLQDNYPEFVAKQVLDCSFWYFDTFWVYLMYTRFVLNVDVFLFGCGFLN